MAETLKIHPVCELFPPMTDDEYGKFKDDIEQHGIREPITTYKGFIVDGKHRHRAARELGIKCPSGEWDGDGSLVLWAVSRNLRRRHLNPSQRAILLQQVLPLIEQETTAKRNATLKRGNQKPIEKANDSPLAPPGGRGCKATDVVAHIGGVGARTIERAKRVCKRRPDLAESVSRGDQRLSEAEAEITASMESETAPVDGRGKPVENKELWPIFRLDTYDDLISRLRAVKRDATALCATTHAPHMSAQDIASAIDNAVRIFKFAKPYAACPQCRAEGCKLCKKTGWLGRMLYDQCVASELKA